MGLDGPILGFGGPEPGDIGTRISTNISQQDAMLASAVSSDISNQVGMLTTAILYDLSTSRDMLASEISTQFSNRTLM